MKAIPRSIKRLAGISFGLIACLTAAGCGPETLAEYEQRIDSPDGKFQSGFVTEGDNGALGEGSHAVYLWQKGAPTRRGIPILRADPMSEDKGQPMIRWDSPTHLTLRMLDAKILDFSPEVRLEGELVKVELFIAGKKVAPNDNNWLFH